jgi:hypothetical protein
MVKLVFLILCFAVFIHAETPDSYDDLPPPEMIEEELTEAQQRFDEAKRMFNPWYSGPLITGSAHVLPMGKYNQQPYLYVADLYGSYDRNRDVQSSPDEVQINALYLAQTGIAPKVDFTLALQGFYNRRQSEGGGGFGDIGTTFGIAILEETPWIPAMKIGIGETFPTGVYNDLNPTKNGIDATGAGSYVTTFTLNMSKVVWWFLLHPMSFRLSFNYKIPTNVTVKNFNAYGGGFNTRGKISPGQSFIGDFAFEYSFTKFWVFALDLSYVYTFDTSFSGTKGTDSNGLPASIGSPSGDQLSLAPAIEYNPFANIGILGGAWFTVYGRNSSAFATGIISYYHVF